jgi:hypothetical protein
VDPVVVTSQERVERGSIAFLGGPHEGMVVEL